MSSARHLERVFGIDIATCQVCGGAVRIIAVIEAPAVIRSILHHLENYGRYATGVSPSGAARCAQGATRAAGAPASPEIGLS